MLSCILQLEKFYSLNKYLVIVIIFLVLHWYLSLFSQSFFLHRYSAHKMFTMTKFWEGFFYVMTYITQGSSYLSPRAYAILHRMHHAFSDTDKDPHSPHHSKNVFTMMWETKNIYNEVLRKEVVVEDRFEHNYPEWHKFEKFADSWISRSSFIALYVAFYVIFATQWWMFLFLPIHFLMGPIQGAVVNWSGHKYGYSNFDNHDKSKNSLIFDIFMLGELFQNNHHKLPMRPNFAVKWFEFDPTYPVIWVLNKLSVIRMVRVRA